MIRGVGAGYHARMTLHAAWSRTVGRPAGAPLRWLAGWGRILFFGACVLVLALSPSTYTPQVRRTMARHIWLDTAPVLRWFSVLCALLTVVITHIVVVTALSYGLSRYALEMVVRVLVLELIPLSAALFAALRSGMAFDASALGLARAGLPTDEATRGALRQLRRDLVPQVVANAVAVLGLATVTSTLVLVLAYLNVYGVSPWGLPDYTRTVGRVFEPVVTIGFALKTVLFGLAVAVIPTAAILELERHPRRLASNVQPGALRLLFVLLLIEAASLAVKYI